MTTGTQQYVLIDGALNPDALRLLYAPDMAREVVPILASTAHAPLSASGPLLASIGPGSQVAEQWQFGQVPFRHAWWLSSSRVIDEFAAHWQRRLVMRTPQDGQVWLRFADARVIARGIEHDAFPAGFWQGTTTIQLPGQAIRSPISAEVDALLDEQNERFFRLDERQLNALSANSTHQESS